MPALKNPKHEKFAQAIVDGLKQGDAYEVAGYPRSPSAASQLANKSEVQVRVQELISEKQAHASEIGDDLDNLPGELTREWLVLTLMKNVQLAQKVGQIAPANKAVEMLAELIGYSFKKPGGAIKPDDEKPSDESGFDMNKMSEGIGNLGEMLAKREAAAKPVDEEE